MSAGHSGQNKNNEKCGRQISLSIIVVTNTAERNQTRLLGAMPQLLFYVDFGPSGVRALPLGCRYKHSGHSTWRYFSSSSSPDLFLYQKEGS